MILSYLVYNLPRFNAMQSTPPPQHVLEISSGEARGEVHQRTTQEWIYHLGVIGFSFQLQDPHPRRTKQRHFFFATSLDPVGLHRSVGEEELQGQLRGERWISHDQIFAFGKDRWIGLGQLVKAHLELVPSVKWQEKRLPSNCKMLQDQNHNEPPYETAENLEHQCLMDFDGVRIAGSIYMSG